MLLPREVPFLENLNSYYLDIDKFTQHLQGEIGAGCIYCKSSAQEILIYFNEQEIIGGILQENGEHAQASPTLEPLLAILRKSSFIVKVFQLDANAIYFWSHLDSFKRAKKLLRSSEISLFEILNRFQKMKFSGFVEVQFEDSSEGAVVFYRSGNKIGGSYFWGQGGLNTSNKNLEELLKKIEKKEATYAVSRFLDSPPISLLAEEIFEVEDYDDEYDAQLVLGLEEFLIIYTKVLYKKLNKDPVLLLRQSFIANTGRFPFLDPFQGQFKFTNGAVYISDSTNSFEVVKGVVHCVWEVIYALGLEKYFKLQLSSWRNNFLRNEGVLIDR